jgi:hypothetical protein
VGILLYVIYLCEDLTPAPPDSQEGFLVILVVCLSIVVALIIILVICLKNRTYGEWKSMDIQSLGT